MKKGTMSMNMGINRARAKVDIAEELMQKIQCIKDYEMHNDEDLDDWQIEAIEKALVKIEVLEDIINQLIG